MSPNQEKLLKLDINSVAALSNVLGFSEVELCQYARISARCYTSFSIKSKPQPFAKLTQSKKFRRIDSPNGRLKHIQDRIYCRLLKPLSLPDHVFGGVAGKSLMGSVALHLNSPVVVKIDIKNFFPSISEEMILHVWQEFFRLERNAALLLTRLTTLDGYLPQGAPTSTALANLVLLSIDKPIRNFCESEGIVYSVWVDDLTFSGQNSQLVVDVVIKSLRRVGLSISRRKLKIMPAHKQQIVTGIITNSRPGISKKYLSSVRSAIHKLATGKVDPSNRERYIVCLKGKIAFVSTINHKKARPLNTQLQAALHTE